jgi:hypothetical protein
MQNMAGFFAVAAAVLRERTNMDVVVAPEKTPTRVLRAGSDARRVVAVSSCQWDTTVRTCCSSHSVY